jgi:Domain of unknown function (DUF4381)
MADSATPLPADPVAGLIDIPLPAPVSLWPQTWPARIAIVLLVVGLIAAAWYLVRAWHTNRYRRAALAELDRITRSPATNDEAATLALLVRRTALAAFPREQVAALAGSAWLAFLDRSYGGDEFSRGVGRALDAAPYQRPRAGTSDPRALIDLVRRWIKGHHV